MTLTVSATVDFDLPGKQRGYLQIGDSTNASGWAMASIPIMSVKAGVGPTVLIVGGSHGDEYEGPFAIANLIRALQLGDITGQVIAVPSLSPMAAASGTRLWSDGIDLNSRFPGDERGTVADKLVAYLAQDLIPRCDAVIDIHSGGRGLICLPAATMTWPAVDSPTGPSTQCETLLRNLTGWRTPFALILPVLPGVDARSQLSGWAALQGTSVYTAVFGGAGITTALSCRLAQQALHCALGHAAVLSSRVHGPAASPADPSPLVRPTIIDLRGTCCYHWAADDGIFESVRQVGDVIEQGELLGWIHHPQSHDQPAVPLPAECRGVLGIVRGFPRVRRGDLCAAVGPSYADASDIPPSPA